jgi:prepilin-type N-terminal cleavage/methylation domain-containing protein
VTRRSATRRRGYTLLEILVASVIGLMLMAALYAAFSLVISNTSIGRDLTAESDLSRGIINRVGLDLSSPVGMLPPKSGGDPNAGGGGGSGADSGTTPTTSTTPTTGTDSGTTPATGTDSGTTPAASGGTPSTDPSTSAASTGSDIPFQAGVVGTSNQLVVFLSRSPEYVRRRGIPYDPSLITPSDLVRVTYYMHSSGQGLCRQERPWVTSDGVWNTTDPDRSTEDMDLIAPEVIAINFEYASGTGYTPSWDGSAGDSAGASCLGPPRAVKMTFTLRLKDKDGNEVDKSINHVFPIRSAVGQGGSVYTPPTDSSGSTTPSTGGSP